MNKLRVTITTMLLSICFATAYANCSKSDIYRLEQKWTTDYDTNNPVVMDHYYAKDAIFIGAFSHQPSLTPESRLAYFKKIFSKADQKLSVHFNVKNPSYIHVIEGGAISSGVYILEKNTNGMTTNTPIRYTMVYRNTPSGCEIIVHHASIATEK